MSDIDHDWISNGRFTHDPADEKEDTSFPCACGDDECKGHGDDPGNLNLNGKWYAAECEMGQQLERIAQGRSAAAKADEARDDFEQERR